MVNTNYNTTEDMINNSQSLEGKTKLAVYQNIRNYFNAMTVGRQSNTFQFEEGTVSEKAESFSKIYHEVFFLMII